MTRLEKPKSEVALKSSGEATEDKTRKVKERYDKSDELAIAYAELHVNRRRHEAGKSDINFAEKIVYARDNEYFAQVISKMHKIDLAKGTEEFKPNKIDRVVILNTKDKQYIFVFDAELELIGSHSKKIPHFDLAKADLAGKAGKITPAFDLSKVNLSE